MDLDAAIEAHLATIRERDLDAFAATLHPDVSVVLPGGQLLAGRDEVLSLHRDWFAEDGWRMELTPEGRRQAGDTGVALYLVDYHDTDDSGGPYRRRYRLSLVFTRQADRWLLLHDQNTDC